MHNNDDDVVTIIIRLIESIIAVFIFMKMIILLDFVTCWLS